jgi:hypothetical protein
MPTRTPREAFLTSGKAADFKKIIASEAFEVACDYAMLELVNKMPPNTTPSLPTDPYVGLDANAQIFGARRVLAILKTLAEPVEQPKPVKPDRLHYE